MRDVLQNEHKLNLVCRSCLHADYSLV